MARPRKEPERDIQEIMENIMTPLSLSVNFLEIIPQSEIIFSTSSKDFPLLLIA